MTKQQQLQPQPKPGRTFITVEAVRKRVPLWVSLNGPSGCGKTKSALRIAAGMQKVVGGKVQVLDTENDRALHYADWFEKTYGYRFGHTHFDPPFGSLDYLAAIHHLVTTQNATVIVADSMSHEHDGIGGLLEQHEAEIDRMQEEQASKGRSVSDRESLSQSAWKMPKMNRRRMINELMQLKVLLVFCFRSKPKQDLKATRPADRDLGFMPVTGDDLIFEMTVSAVLPPMSRGLPDWSPKKPGERSIIKKGPFEELFKRAQQFNEEVGEEMAKWALGGDVPKLSAQAERGGEAERAALVSRFRPLRLALKWDETKTREWLNATFGSPQVKPLTMQQLTDAVTLLDMLANGGQEEYDQELAGLIELGRVKLAADPDAAL